MVAFARILGDTVAKPQIKKEIEEKKYTSVERWKESIIIQSHKFQDKTLYIERQQNKTKNPIAKKHK